MIAGMNMMQRRRLSPDERRDHLLDVTQAVILESGLNSFTMDVLARNAGVSNTLAYKYFDTRLELLQTLLLREYQRFFGSLKRDLNLVPDFHSMVVKVVTANFDETSKGSIIPILRDQSDVDAVLLNKEDDHLKVARMIVKRVQNQYGIGERQARMVTKFASGASYAAAEFYLENGGDRDKLIESAVEFILAGIENLR